MNKIILVAVVCLLSTTAYAQQPIEYNLKVSGPEVDMIGKALGTLPFNDVAAIIQKLRTQIFEQQKAAEAKPAPVSDPDKPAK